MRKKIFISGLMLIATIIVFACSAKENNDAVSEKIIPGDQGIQFIESNWSKALQEAKQQHKLLFIDAYTTWCGPCKLLKKNTFTDKEAGDFFNSNFINIAVDMEKGEGPVLAEKYKVDSYPTLLITDADGNLITYSVGLIGPSQLIAFGKHGLTQNKK